MKKNLFLVTAALVSSLLWVGCNKSGKLSQTSTFKPPIGPVELKLKWPVGERVSQTLDVKMNMQISGGNLPNTINQDVTLGEDFGLNVLKADADGGHEVEMEFRGIRIKVDQGGKSVVDYDSAKKSAPSGNDPSRAAVEKMFQNVIGIKIQYFLDASNQVERLEGYDKLMNALTVGGRAGAATDMFNEGSLKQMISGQHLPSKPVQPGDSWPVQTDVTMGDLGTMAMNYTFDFVRWESRGKRTCARLEFQGTMKSKASQDATATGVTVSVQNGDASGVSWFDPELGMVIETIMDQNMNMNMTVPVPGRKNATQAMAMVMKQAITMKLNSVK